MTHQKGRELPSLGERETVEAEELGGEEEWWDHHLPLQTATVGQVGGPPTGLGIQGGRRREARERSGPGQGQREPGAGGAGQEEED